MAEASPICRRYVQDWFTIHNVQWRVLFGDISPTVIDDKTSEKTICHLNQLYKMHLNMKQTVFRNVNRKTTKMSTFGKVE